MAAAGEEAAAPAVTAEEASSSGPTKFSVKIPVGDRHVSREPVSSLYFPFAARRMLCSVFAHCRIGVLNSVARDFHAAVSSWTFPK